MSFDQNDETVPDRATPDLVTADQPSTDQPGTDQPSTDSPPTRAPRRRRAASRPAGPPAAVEPDPASATGSESGADGAGAQPEPEAPAPRKRATRRKKAAVEPVIELPPEPQDAAQAGAGDRAAPVAEQPRQIEGADDQASAGPVLAMPLFQPPEMTAAAPRRRRAASRPSGPPAASAEAEESTGPTGEKREDETGAQPDGPEASDDEALGTSEDESSGRRRRRRGGRGRRGRRDEEESENSEDGAAAPEAPDAQGRDTAGDGEDGDDAESDGSGSRRRRRRRRRGSGDGSDEDPNTVARGRQPRSGGDVSGVRGSTRLEAKKQRRREGREAGRRRPVITEAEFLARRESVERVMVLREREGRTQIAVLEDGVLVEHYVARRTQTSMVGNVYLGRVQNVLPSMEAAFVDVSKGRNGVLYAGEVNWDAAGLDGQPKRIEHALSAGESVLVQVTKDPIGHKGARLTSQISLPGRYLVYVPDGSMTGISRKLPDTERARLKRILREVVPDNAGVIVRTAAEGASEEELSRDVARLAAQWADISAKASSVSAPALLYGEPDLAIRVVRDIFNEDFASLVVSGEETWDILHAYIGHVAPDLVERMQRWDTAEQVDGVERGDVFAAHRVDEQLAKALDRKVWLPSGGSLVIDRTEAMTVVDVNTGKFTGAGGNLEETVTKNNLEAAEEIVRQLRVRDIGGIIVVDFIDMVLESNRELVLRRLLECLGRDRTKHQVAEVTSLGLVQMTRKRVGQGLLEVFSETCEHCAGRGVIVHDEPVEKRQQDAGSSRGGRRGGRSAGGSGRSSGSAGGSSSGGSAPTAPSSGDTEAAAPDAMAG